MTLRKITKKIAFIVLILLVLSSCTSRKKLIYHQNIDKINLPSNLGDFEPVYNVDDALMILVTTDNPEAAAPFNLLVFSTNDNSTDLVTLQKRQLNYIVEKALEYKLGARGLRSLCEAILTEAMYEFPSSEDKHLQVTKEYAENSLSKNLLHRLKAAS